MHHHRATPLEYVALVLVLSMLALGIVVAVFPGAARLVAGLFV